MKRLDHRFRIARGDAKQRQRGAAGRPAPLLPIPERGHADTDHEGEFHLRLAQVAPQRLYVRRLERGRARRLAAPTTDLAGLTDTGEQFFEGGSFYLNFSRTSAAKGFACG